ncbi:hypothetical protein BJ165DRAFT_1595512 [Panaeolus papilionaceus]|nr:hypothetical protein BJ165DRAFT_1595512 [Panaeolus papilionaceus]
MSPRKTSPLGPERVLRQLGIARLTAAHAVSFAEGWSYILRLAQRQVSATLGQGHQDPAEQKKGCPSIDQYSAQLSTVSRCRELGLKADLSGSCSIDGYHRRDAVDVLATDNLDAFNAHNKTHKANVGFSVSETIRHLNFTDKLAASGQADGMRLENTGKYNIFLRPHVPLSHLQGYPNTYWVYLSHVFLLIMNVLRNYFEKGHSPSSFKEGVQTLDWYHRTLSDVRTRILQ